MSAGLPTLKRYQRPRRSRPFDNLPPQQRAVAEGHYERLCARWEGNLPPWRRAILAGRAKDLAVRPRDATWAHRMRRRQSRQPTITQSAPPVDSPPVAHLLQSMPAARSTNMASSPAPTVEASQPSCGPTPPPLADSPLSSPPSGAVRLDLNGVTASGTDGHDTAQRILRDLDNAFGRTVRFSMAVPGKDLPPRWAWRLEVVPVP